MSASPGRRLLPDPIPVLTDRLDVPRLDGRGYLEELRGLLDDPVRLGRLERWMRAAVTSFAREEMAALRPGWAPALSTLALNLGVAAGSLVLAAHLVGTGWWAAAVPVVGVAGLALYGLVTILHDTLHLSFLPGKAANRWLGEVLAPIFFLDQAGFARSHLGHHRHNQSTTHDPKYPRIPRPRVGVENGESPVFGLAGPLAGLPTPMRLWFGAMARVARLPLPVRHLVYLGSTLVTGAFTVLVYGGDLALGARDWKTPRPWLSLARSLALHGAAFWLSPRLGLLLLAATWLALSLVFLVFLTHLSPYQIYGQGEGRHPLLFALNISDIRLGWLVRRLGNGFADHHAAHHVFPFVPCYRLGRASAWLEERFGGLKAPVLDLRSPRDSAAVFDGLTASTTRPRNFGWYLWATAAGVFVRRAARYHPGFGRPVGGNLRRRRVLAHRFRDPWPRCGGKKAAARGMVARNSGLALPKTGGPPKPR